MTAKKSEIILRSILISLNPDNFSTMCRDAANAFQSMFSSLSSLTMCYNAFYHYVGNPTDFVPSGFVLQSLCIIFISIHLYCEQ